MLQIYLRKEPQNVLGKEQLLDLMEKPQFVLEGNGLLVELGEEPLIVHEKILEGSGGPLIALKRERRDLRLDWGGRGTSG